METFDYIIVGAGSAGSVLAARLSERSNASICVIEAGPRDRHPMIHLPVGWMKLMNNARHNWMYEAEPSAWTGGRHIGVPRGKVMGGSSSINGNIFNRGAPSDFDHWAQRGNRGWSYEDVLPLFRRMENWLGPDDQGLRGRNGPLTVTPTPWTHPLCDAFIAAAESLGIPRNPDYNGTHQFGVSYSQRTIARGWRQSASVAFLRPALKRPNLEIRTDLQVTKVLIEGPRATGLQAMRGQTQVELHARREIILSCGAINSPQLLQISGIGDPEHLASLGVRVIHALPGVGQNLQDHYTPRFTARVKDADTFNEKARGLPFLWETAKWLAGKPSILNVQSTACYAFAKSDPHLEDSDLQITFMPASYKEGVQSQLEDLPGMTLAAWQQRPESRGYVKARTSNAFDKPEIQPNYLESETDQRVLLAGLKLVRRLMRSVPMQPYFESELYPGDEVTTDAELMETARQRGTSTFHLMGTCRMAPDTDPTAVVDDTLRVHGLEGLRIADASIMPTMPAANTNAASLMIGEKAADLITLQNEHR